MDTKPTQIIVEEIAPSTPDAQQPVKAEGNSAGGSWVGGEIEGLPQPFVSDESDSN